MTHPGFQQKLGDARQLLLSGNLEEAFASYRKLTRTFPGQSAVWFEFGTTASRLGQRDVATRAWERALAIEPRNVALIVQVGHQYAAWRTPELARACVVRAALADSQAIDPRISLAGLSEQQHRLADARAVVEECLAIDPRDDQARYLSAVLDRREGRIEAAEGRLRDLIQSDPRHPYVRYACRYELAQILDRTGRFHEAMKFLVEAKQIVRSLTDIEVLLRSYDHAAEASRRVSSGLPQDILTTWAKSFPAEEREPTPPLAFLGGHPRSGTTLLEQILDAHAGIAALDEPLAFGEVLQPAFRQLPDQSVERLNYLRRIYAEALQVELDGAGAERLLLDKNPSFTASLPLWLRVFPEIRIIIALRDPRDVVLSCYFQNLLLNPTNANFLTFDRLAKHYADLMDVWLAVREWEGFAWLETRYEAVVSDLEGEGRRATSFLGRDWREEQTRSHEPSQHKQFYSPTYQDVTRPVYCSSVGRWRAYEKHLAPILPALDSYCRRFGYD